MKKHYAYESPFKMKDNDGNEYTLTVDYDECAEDPRNWDNLCTMICWHNHYSLGDKHNFVGPQSCMKVLYKKIIGKSWNDNHESDNWDDIFNALNQSDLVFIKIIRLYDHSGITISTSNSYPYNDRWDSSIVGFIYVTKEQILNEIANANEENWTAIADKIIENEIETYDQYVRGDVYWFGLTEKVIKQDKCPHCGEVIREYEYEEEINSCSGFYGDCLEENGILEYIDGLKFMED